MSYRNARLANGFLSLDKLAKKLDLVKSRRVSDCGAGVERMVGDIDRRPGDVERDESIRELAAKRKLSYHAAEVRYFGHREKILNFFGVQ